MVTAGAEHGQLRVRRLGRVDRRAISRSSSREAQPTTTTPMRRGPCTPVTRIFSMSEVALGPVTSVIAAGGGPPPA